MRVGEALRLFAAAVWCCACFAACKKAPDPADVEPNRSLPHAPASKLPWVRKTEAAEVAIVFVHGLFGDARSTWTNPGTGAFWPEMLTKDSTFNGANIYCYQYRTPKTGPALTIAELAGNMNVVLKEDGVLAHKKIFFVAHSMGGILTRQFLLDYNDRDLIDRVKLLYFFGVPSTGSQLASLFDYFSKNPQVLQLRPIQRDNMLGEQMNRWINQRFPFPTYAAYETQPTHGFPVVPFEGAVSGSSSSIAIDGDHLNLVCPADERAMSYMVFRLAYRTATASLLDSATEKIRLNPNQLFNRAAILDVDDDITVPEGAVIVANRLEFGHAGVLRGRSITVIAQQIANGRIVADGEAGRDGLLGDTPDEASDVPPGSGQAGGKITIYAAEVQNAALQARGGIGGVGARGRNGRDGSRGADGQNGDCRPLGKWKPAHPGANGGDGGDGTRGQNGGDGGAGGQVEVYLANMNERPRCDTAGGAGGPSGEGGNAGEGGPGGRGGAGCTGLGGSQMTRANGQNGRSGVPGARGDGGHPGPDGSTRFYELSFDRLKQLVRDNGADRETLLQSLAALRQN